MPRFGSAEQFGHGIVCFRASFVFVKKFGHRMAVFYVRSGFAR